MCEGKHATAENKKKKTNLKPLWLCLRSCVGTKSMSHLSSVAQIIPLLVAVHLCWMEFFNHASFFNASNAQDELCAAAWDQ